MMTTVIFVLGAFIALLNFYTSFFRRPLHNWLRPDEPAKSVSGFPFVGSVLLIVAWWLLPSGSVPSWSAILLFVLDTGGPHWFILALIRQR